MGSSYIINIVSIIYKKGIFKNEKEDYILTYY